MRKTLLYLAAALAALTISAPATAAPALTGARAALAAGRLDLASMLTYAVQDERAALAEYRAVLARLGEVRPFSSIVRAEESHLRSLEPLLAAHGVAIPAETATAPIRVKDLASALEAGREAEIDNIAMYERFLSQELPADVRSVFEQLKAASQNHLRALTRVPGRST